MTEEIFAATCEECGNELEIVSPATLSCNVCGCGSHRFPTTMEFECFYKHKQVGNVSKVCSECINVERTMYRTFKRKQKAEVAKKKPAAPRKRPATKTTKSGIKRRVKKK